MKATHTQILSLELTIGEVRAVLEDLGIEAVPEDVPLDGRSIQFVTLIEMLKQFRGDYDRIGG